MAMEKPRPMLPEEKDKVLKTLTAALYDDPLSVYLLPAQKDRDRWLGVGLETLFALESEPDTLVVDGCAGVVSAYPPGPADEGFFSELAQDLKSLSPKRIVGGALGSATLKFLRKVGTAAPPDSRRAQVLDALAGIASRKAIAGVPPKAILGIVQLMGAFEDKPVPEPHYYISFLAVHPDHRGKGLGRRLLRPVLAGADKAGLPCYTDVAAQEGVGFAAKFGFETVEEFKPLPDGPAVFRLRRPAKA